MRNSLKAVVVVLLALVAGRATAADAQSRSERLFYYVDSEDSYKSLVQNIGRIDVVAPSAYGVDEQGIVWGDVDTKVIELAKRNNVKLMPLLVNRPFNK